MGMLMGAMALGQCVISPIAGLMMSNFPGIILAVTLALCVLLIPWVSHHSLGKSPIRGITTQSAVLNTD